MKYYHSFSLPRQSCVDSDLQICDEIIQAPVLAESNPIIRNRNINAKTISNNIKCSVLTVKQFLAMV